MVSYERLPMLEIVFDRLIRLMTTSLRNFTSDNVEVSLDRITSVRFGDYLNSIPLPSMLAVFKAEEWDNYGLCTLNSNLIYSIIDVLLGGRRGHSAVYVEGRPYTTIETNIIKRMIDLVLATLRRHSSHCRRSISWSSGWRPIRGLPRSRGKPMPRSWCGCASTWRIAAATSKSCCRTPRSSRFATSCCRCSPAKNSAATRSGKAISRPKSDKQRFRSTPCSTKPTFRLRQVMNLEVGDTLPLEIKPDALVSVRCGDVTLTEGRIGRVGDRVAVRVARPLRKPKMTYAMFEMSGEPAKPMEAS